MTIAWNQSVSWEMMFVATVLLSCGEFYPSGSEEMLKLLGCKMNQNVDLVVFN